MKISVIIPTFNREDLLKRSVSSVLNQTHAELELIIVDDGSTDNSRQVAKDFLSDSRVRYVYQENSGVSSARNLGVSVSSFEWVSFLDSDDEWLENKLQKQVELHTKKPDLLFIHTEENWIRNGKKVNKPKQYKKHGGYIFSKCLSLCAIAPSAVLMHKSLFNEMYGFSTDYTVCEDFELWLKVTSKYEVGLVDEPLVNKYGGHEDQLSTKFFAMDLYRVRALFHILNIRNLSLEEQTQVKEVALKKCDILLKGYEKHSNFKDYDEVKSLQLRLRS